MILLYLPPTRAFGRSTAASSTSSVEMAYATRSICALLLATAFAPRNWAQNLIPNGGYEEFTISCEFGIGYSALQDWRYLNCGNPPGLAHACNNAVGNGGGVPQSALGFQHAHGGDGFITTWPLMTDSKGGAPDGNPQKYANVDLVQPLTAGQRYCLRLWMNMADSSSYRTDAFHAYVGYGVPTLCNYADTAWDTYATATWDISAVDTSDWTSLEAEFLANGGETNITLGAFQFDDEIHSTFIADHSELFGALIAIYYIDDVELWPCQVGVPEEDVPAAFDLYPNPADDRITLSLSGNASVRIALFDVVGRLATPAEWAAPATIHGTRMLDTSGLLPGRYMLRLVREDGSVASRPLTIQH